MAKYVIAYFKVSQVLAGGKISEDPTLYLFNPSEKSFAFENAINSTIEDRTRVRIKNNAHSKRDSDDYFIVIGDPISQNRLSGQ